MGSGNTTPHTLTPIRMYYGMCAFRVASVLALAAKPQSLPFTSLPSLHFPSVPSLPLPFLSLPFLTFSPFPSLYMGGAGEGGMSSFVGSGAS